MLWDNWCQAGIDNLGYCNLKAHKAWHAEGGDCLDVYRGKYDRCRRQDGHEGEWHLLDGGGAMTTYGYWASDWHAILAMIVASGEVLRGSQTPEDTVVLGSPGIDTSIRLMRPSEVSKLMRVGKRTPQGWARAGKLTKIKTPGGEYRFLESEIRAMLEDE